VVDFDRVALKSPFSIADTQAIVVVPTFRIAD